MVASQVQERMEVVQHMVHQEVALELMVALRAARILAHMGPVFMVVRMGQTRMVHTPVRMVVDMILLRMVVDMDPVVVVVVAIVRHM
jgi:hypothetical protein